MNYINGWTKEKVIEHVKANFKGKSNIIDGIEFGVCAYRGIDDKKCIAGCFLPDDLYQKNMEGLNARTLVEKHNVYTFPLEPIYMELWQDIHDNKLKARMSLEEQINILLNFLEERE